MPNLSFSDPTTLAGLGALALAGGGLGAYRGLNSKGTKADRRKAALRNALLYGGGAAGAAALGIGGLDMIRAGVDTAGTPMPVHALNAAIGGAGGGVLQRMLGGGADHAKALVEQADKGLAGAANTLHLRAQEAAKKVGGPIDKTIADLATASSNGNGRAVLAQLHGNPALTKSLAEVAKQQGRNLSADIHALEGSPLLRGAISSPGVSAASNPNVERIMRGGRGLLRSRGAAIGGGATLGLLASGLGGDAVSGVKYLAGL